MQRFNSSHTYWWLCLFTWFGLSMSMWQAISLTLLTWTTLKCHLSKEMYNDYLQDIIITYFIKCHNMSSDWISLYANIIDISIFVIFWYDIMSSWVWWTPCSYCNANIHVTPLCAHSMGSLDSLQSILWSPGVKIPWIHVPQAGLLQDISKNHEYHIALFKNKKELKPQG